ncbi:helix-turn-helix domain-containing protein [uncultured Cycloclasticus sp.]|uniref:MerR family transcriptional regulator n=1 Tax=uncultured Cycloclasticus sp. TaxID=172194 RepID=UPI00258FB681|nr:helix-turn-helix domain-containing protein [uncultured Cycloclasticus sp.]
MSITRGELAKRTGCNLETIRYYEKIGLMPDPSRSKAGYRQYDQNHLKRLQFIMRGRELGFTMEDLKSLLGLVDKKAVSCSEVSILAKGHLESVQQKITDLKRIERALSNTLISCSGKDVPECPVIDTLLFGAS